MSGDNPLVQKALEKIEFHRAELARLKRFVNDADRLEDRPPRFQESEDDLIESPGGVGLGPSRAGKYWKPGDFYGETFSGAVRRVLEARREVAGVPAPASVDEIHEALLAGSFDFGTNGVDAQKTGIRISLGKNSAAFVKLPNSDVFGLRDWYGSVPRKNPRKLSPGPSPESASQAGEGEEAADDAAASDVDQIREEDREA
jgi:hypothetical protein